VLITALSVRFEKIMNRLLRSALICAFFCIQAFVVCSQSSAQSLTITKGTTVVPKFNSQVIQTKFNVWTGIKNIVLIEQNGNSQITLNGSEDWRGVPLMSEFQFNKMERKKEYAEIKLKNDRAELKLRFGNSVKDLEKAFQEIAFVGTISAFEKSDYFKKEVVDVLFPKVFRGSLSKLDSNTQMELMRSVGYDIDAIGNTDYKDEQYLAIRVPVGIEYNTLRVNQAERTSQVVEQKILAQLRAMYKKIGKLKGLKGFKVSAKVGYRNFLERFSATQYDDLEIYAPLEEIAKFDDADITSQELIDKSVVLINGNRVRVSLTQFSS
jgi:hypothetical protein